MFSAKTYGTRRNLLRTKIDSGIVLLPGNAPAPNNYPNNAYYFRQDSTFLYYFGLNLPSLVGVIDVDSGEEMLFGDDFTVEDIIWTGPQPTLRELGAQVGITATFPLAALEERLRKAIALGRRIHYLPPYRGETKLQLSALLGIRPALLHEYKSVDLMFAVAEMREKKSAEEVEELERAFRIGYEMHTTAMRMCRPGVVEREIAGAIEGIAKSHGLGVSFPSIVSQHGETLHNLNSDGVLQSGRLLLCDAGGEALSNYVSDHTRTYPVSGKFTEKQKDVYNLVLAAHDHVARIVKPHMMYTEVHRAAYTVLAEGLIALGLMKGSAQDAVAAGAMTLFMPHGLGHGIGLDVHDCEAMGERSFDFASIAERAARSATCIYRAAWRIEPGTVMSDEPGIYFIPALIDKCRAEGLYKGIVDYDALDAYRDFGGIRIEDDLLVTETGCRIIGDRKIPVTVEELEAVVGKDIY
ncbi:MAG: Xaa-Pro aminopeptidase [Alistipes senegalensis]|nr:Xaa-Pro aminopeptidase [Bacteroides cellulosilyticus]MCM1353044.1 Xaa-Pro aminopeptidase [Alistipes senegalensis]